MRLDIFIFEASQCPYSRIGRGPTCTFIVCMTPLTSYTFMLTNIFVVIHLLGLSFQKYGSRVFGYWVVVNSSGSVDVNFLLLYWPTPKILILFKYVGMLTLSIFFCYPVGNARVICHGHPMQYICTILFTYFIPIVKICVTDIDFQFLMYK